MQGVFLCTCLSISSTYLLNYPGAICHQCKGGNPVITCPLAHLLSFVLHTWSSELWPVLLGALIRVGALRV